MAPKAAASPGYEKKTNRRRRKEDTLMKRNRKHVVRWVGWSSLDRDADYTAMRRYVASVGAASGGIVLPGKGAISSILF